MAVGGHNQFQNIDSSKEVRDKHLTPLTGFLLDKMIFTKLVRKFRDS